MQVLFAIRFAASIIRRLKLKQRRQMIIVYYHFDVKIVVLILIGHLDHLNTCVQIIYAMAMVSGMR
ncbi:hypothetical protein T10_9642 [Trichinella papuae]|uniref:Uncharacterized protein n=1 Tax=Trichinella papuae TaxID=268474 RepID=A0A0V1N747_9BILA|nr:hypothetical protein T10_9642 [Trichinella papuae]